jgi:hypothetical protein
MLSDLSPTHGPGWQALDLATRAIKTALRSVEFQKLPAVVAVAQSCLNSLTELVTNYTTGTAGATSSSPKPSKDQSGGGESTATDADSQPNAQTGAETAAE